MKPASGRRRCAKSRKAAHRRDHQRMMLVPAGADFTASRMLVPSGADFTASASPTLVDDGNERMHAAVAKVERMLGYSFQDPRLLEEALTHPSHPNNPSYQRVEFVGDAALCLAFTNPGVGPGQLSTLRAANISTEKLARVAVCHGLYPLVRRNSPNLDHMVAKFTKSVMRESGEDFGELPYGGTIVKAPKVLADIVESIAAAVYIDCDFDLGLVWRVFRGLLEPIITAENLDEQPVKMLHEWCQKRGVRIHFKDWKKGQRTIVNVFIDGQLVGVASSEQKMIAKLTLQGMCWKSCPASRQHLWMPSPACQEGMEKQSQ